MTRAGGQKGSRGFIVGLALSSAVVLGAWWMLGDDSTPPDARQHGAVVQASGRADVPRADGRAPDAEVPDRLPVREDVLTVLVTTTVRTGVIRPIAGADVLPVVVAQGGIRADARPGIRRKTDGEGRAQLPLSEVAAAALVVRAPGCFTSTMDADELADFARSGETLEVQLRRSYLLSGKVATWGPDPVPAGMAVLAWSTAERPTRADVLELLERERHPGAADAGQPERSDVMLTRTAFGGRYQFPTRVPDGRWTLMAAGLGYATNGDTRAVVGEGQGVALTAWSAHTLAVQVTDHQGVPLEERPGVSRRSTAWSAGSKLQHSAFDPVERLLLDVEVPAQWGPVRLVDVRAPGFAPTAGPVVLNLKEPGFEKHSIQLDVPTTRDGLRLQTIALTPTWEELGALTVVLKGWDQHVGDLAKDPLVALDLSTEGGERRYLYLKDIRNDRVLLDGIEYGTYRARFEIQNMFVDPEVVEPVVISATPATLTVDLTGYASLDVELVTADGSPYRGPASLFMGLEGSSVPGVGEYYAFKRPPYRIPFVSQHKWKPHLQGSHSLEGPEGAAARGPVVELAPGETGTVRLVVGGP